MRPPTITTASGRSISVPCSRRTSRGSRPEDRGGRGHDLRPHAPDARLAQRLVERPSFGQEPARLGHEHEAVLDGDAEQADEADERRDVPRLAGQEQGDDAADERDGEGAEDDEDLGRRSQGEVEQHEDGDHGRARRQQQRACRALLALDASADVEEVARGKRQAALERPLSRPRPCCRGRGRRRWPRRRCAGFRPRAAPPRGRTPPRSAPPGPASPCCRRGRR